MNASEILTKMANNKYMNWDEKRFLVSEGFATFETDQFGKTMILTSKGRSVYYPILSAK